MPDSGVDTTTARTRRKYWVIRGHDVTKAEKNRCTLCRMIEAKVENQFMANLPASRLQPYTPPFMFTSCDYFGPIKVKIGRNKTTKHYGVIFTCTNTRAVHCEFTIRNPILPMVPLVPFDILLKGTLTAMTLGSRMVNLLGTMDTNRQQNRW
jgi:hypothetical protein